MRISTVLTLCCVMLFGCAAEPPDGDAPSPAPSAENRSFPSDGGPLY